MKFNTVVNTQRDTNIGRVVSFLSGGVGLALQLNVIDALAAERATLLLNSMVTQMIIGVALQALPMVLPAIQRWSNREKELPEGVTMKDVVVKPVEQSKDSSGVVKTLSMIAVACCLAVVVSGCTRADCERLSRESIIDSLLPPPPAPTPVPVVPVQMYAPAPTLEK